MNRVVPKLELGKKPSLKNTAKSNIGGMKKIIGVLSALRKAQYKSAVFIMIVTVILYLPWKLGMLCNYFSM